jgi:hypothetical protein
MRVLFDLIVDQEPLITVLDSLEKALAGFFHLCFILVSYLRSCPQWPLLDLLENLRVMSSLLSHGHTVFSLIVAG